MAPTIPAAMSPSQDHLSLTHKLRKPVVEKLRRERINCSIEQLKSLLAAEFLKQQPESKLEKADILEMAVSFMKHLQQQQHEVVGQGYSRCAQEMSQFLCKEQQQSQSQRRQLLHFNKLECSSQRILTEAHFTVHKNSSKDKSLVSNALWRPW